MLNCTQTNSEGLGSLQSTVIQHIMDNKYKFRHLDNEMVLEENGDVLKLLLGNKPETEVADGI